MRRPVMNLRRVQHGFTLLESLVAMLVIAFGLLSLAGMQLTLSRNADVAKQRGEATRLAQQQIELMRSYTTIAAAAGHTLTWEALANGADAITTNTNFTRTWTLGGTSSDSMRRASVALSWVDRADQTHTLTLNTVISQTDPADMGALGFPAPQNSTLRRPRNRSMNIPVPAVDLGDGRSLSTFGNFAVIFSNDSGYVVQRCDGTATASSLDSCVDYEAYILAGYVSKTMNSFPTNLNISTSGITGFDPSRSIECSFATATDQNTSATLSDYKYYLCVVPVTADGTWSGRVNLAGMASGTNYLVCRMEYPPSSGSSANARNVQPYVTVNDSLDNQNYIVTTSNSCPTVESLVTTLHQTCTSSNSNRTADCPAS